MCATRHTRQHRASTGNLHKQISLHVGSEHVQRRDQITSIEIVLCLFEKNSYTFILCAGYKQIRWQTLDDHNEKEDRTAAVGKFETAQLLTNSIIDSVLVIGDYRVLGNPNQHQPIMREVLHNERDC